MASEVNYDIGSAQEIPISNLEEVWPIYHRNEVEIGDVYSPMAVTTLWTERQPLTKRMDRNDFSAIGQCYSPLGMNHILRELLANPNIRNLAVWGRDGTDTGEYLSKFFNNGFNDDRTIPGVSSSIKIHEEIPKEELEALRENVKITDLRSSIAPDKYDQASQTISEISRSLAKNPWRNHGIRYPLGSVKTDTMPGEMTGYKAQGHSIGETWLDILDTILRFGKVKEIPGEDFKKDIPFLEAIVFGNEDHINMINPEIFKNIPNFKEAVQRYVSQFTSGDAIPGSAYCYGQELFAHNSQGEIIDQIKYIVGKLSSNQHTGRAFASTWDVARHMKASESPCLVDVQFSTVNQGVSQDKYDLLLAAHFKTHDMFNGWPPNVFGLRELHKHVLNELISKFEERGLDLSLGPLMTFSGSAHIYGAMIENAQKTLEEFPLEDNRNYSLSGRLNQDPRGSFKFTIENNGEREGIKINHYHPQTGEEIESGFFPTQRQAQRWIADKRYSDPMHGIYLGGEISKAASVLKLRRKGINAQYLQDKPIVIE